MSAGKRGMPARFCRKSGCTGWMSPARHSARFQGWESNAPTLEQVTDSGVSVLKAGDLTEPETGMLCTSVKLRQKLYPKYVPELITVIIAERFSGISLEMAIGRKTGLIDDDTAYLNWTEVNDVGRWNQDPASTFVPPGENGAINLSLRIRGDKEPESGLLYFFIRARLWQI